jgi:hypothetical protein
MEDKHDDTPMLVLPDSIEIGGFHIYGGYRIADLSLILCGRQETFIVFVEPHSDEIGVEVYEAMLDYLSLTVVAEHVAAKLNTVAGRAALELASEASKQHRRWLPQVWVRPRCSAPWER